MVGFRFLRVSIGVSRYVSLLLTGRFTRFESWYPGFYGPG